MSAPFRMPVPADLSEAARVLHLRRQLAAAVDHGTALLAALGLPRLVDADFVPLDPATIGEAVEAAVAALDAMDGDTDLEDGADDEASLGWEKPGSQLFLTDGSTLGDDRELDTADHEPSLASPERHPRVPTVTWGKAYTAHGGEEGQLRWAEGARHDGELDPCDGPIDDDELDEDGLSRGEGDHADDEPTLGAPAGGGDQEHWAQGHSTSNDPEGDDADAEPEEGIVALWVFGPSRREVAHPGRHRARRHAAPEAARPQGRGVRRREPPASP